MLLDTGVLIALLDRSEKNHERCVAFFKGLKAPLFTTEPVLTETLWLLGASIKAQQICIDFFLRGGATLVPQSKESLLRASVLMAKYNDVPMDFADATLVSLAEETDAVEILTLDRRGFSTYRIRGNKAFTIWP